MRVLVVAPYPPQRDGIAVYARTQVEALRGEGHDVTVLSPPEGQGDVRAPFRGGGALLRAARLGRGFDRIVLHFQPLLYFAPHAPLSKLRTAYALRRLALAGGSRLEIVVHEADPPNLWRPDYRGIRRAFERAGTVSFHTRMEWEAFERGYRARVNGRVVPQLAVPPRVETREEARRGLGIAVDGAVFVCAGFVQPTKGFDRAVDAFEKAAADGARTARAPRLYVVGSVRELDPGHTVYAEELAARCRSVAGVSMVPGYLSEQDFDRWLSAADWVVLPYRRSFSSGVLARAHALGRPAIVSAVGGLPEQAGEADLLVRDDEELTAALRRAAAGE